MRPTSPIDSLIIAGLTGQPLDAIIASPQVREIGSLFIRDPLTALYNRRYLQRRLALELEAAQTAGSSLSLLLLDLNDFKQVNDTHGHAAGDRILAHLALVLCELIPDDGVVVRYGGDEFIVLLPGWKAAEALRLGRTVADDLAQREVLVEHHAPFSMSTSIGVAIYPDDASDYSELVAAADLAMYYAKGQRLGVASYAQTPAAKGDERVHLNRVRPHRIQFSHGTATALLTRLRWDCSLGPAEDTAIETARQRFDDLFGRWMDRYGGYEQRSDRDPASGGALFSTPSDALEAALDFALRIQAEPWPHGLTLDLRMALHTDRVTLDHGRYAGPALDEAALVLLATRAGQILVSGQTAESSTLSTPPHSSLHALGTHRLADLRHSVSLYLLEHPGLTPPPDRTPCSWSVVPNNLPTQSNRFIGRKECLNQLQDLLIAARLVTVGGPGGGGKSRLALHAAARMADRFSAGVWLIELAPLSTAAQVAKSIANILGIAERLNEPLAQTIATAIGIESRLLILDNCEHLAQAVAEIAEQLVGGCPNLRILATSRLPLQSGSELYWRLPPLDLPNPIDDKFPELLATCESVQLFLSRVQERDPSFQLDEQKALDVAQLCRRLEGSPLTLELAAARVSSHAISEIADSLQRPTAEESGISVDSHRHETLLAMVAWSYRLLSDQERLLLCRLAVFSGSFPDYALPAVCSSELLPADTIDTIMAQLVNHSLVLIEESGEAKRYRLLETIRTFAERQLELSGEWEPVRRRHAEWCLALAEEAKRNLDAKITKEWLDALEQEQANLEAALRWTTQSPQAAELGLHLGGALVDFYMYRGPRGEGPELVEQLLAGPTGTDPARAAAHRTAGIAAYRRGDMDGARLHFDQSLTHHRQSGDRKGVASMLHALGAMTFVAGDRHSGYHLYEEALAVRLEIGDHRGAVNTLTNLGQTHLDRGELERARLFLERALQISRQHDLQNEVARTCYVLSPVLRLLGDLQGAFEMAREAVSLARSLESTSLLSDLLCILGDAAVVLGNPIQAESCAKEALSLAKGLAFRMQEILAYQLTGHVRQMLGDFAGAIALYDVAESDLRAVGDNRILAGVLYDKGMALFQAGEVSRANEIGREALAVTFEAKLIVEMTGSLNLMAALAAAKGDHVGAATMHGAAEHILHDLGVVVRNPWELAVVMALRAKLDEDLGPDVDALMQSGAAMELAEVVALSLHTHSSSS